MPQSHSHFDLGDSDVSYEGTATEILDPPYVADTVVHILEAPRTVRFNPVVLLPVGEWV